MHAYHCELVRDPHEHRTTGRDKPAQNAPDIGNVGLVIQNMTQNNRIVAAVVILQCPDVAAERCRQTEFFPGKPDPALRKIMNDGGEVGAVIPEPLRDPYRLSRSAL